MERGTPFSSRTEEVKRFGIGASGRERLIGTGASAADLPNEMGKKPLADPMGHPYSARSF